MQINTTTGTFTDTMSNTAHQFWSEPELIKAIQTEDKLEMLYKQYSLLSLGYSVGKRVFKVEYTRIEGNLWKQSDRIYGEIVPAQEESYKF